MKTVAVSGGFDPIHAGHVRYLNEARALGDRLVVILNNDNWLRKKKGFAFMSEEERKEVIEAFSSVDEVVITAHGLDSTDMSVCDALRQVQPNIFANGGDRTHDNIPEGAVCKEIGCEMVFNVGAGGKMQSSSWLLENYKKYVLVHQPRVGVGVMVIKEGRILLGKRKGSHGEGEWAFPGGHLEYLESFEECAVRETREECGFEITNIHFQFVENITHYAPKHYLYIGLIADWKSGDPVVKEIDRQESWEWFDFNSLPAPLFFMCQRAIAHNLTENTL